jgi:hypothetical protein
MTRPRMRWRFSARASGLGTGHCGTYLNTLVGVERERVATVRAKLRELSHQHANEIAREVEITFYITQLRRVWFTPEGTP